MFLILFTVSFVSVDCVFFCGKFLKLIRNHYEFFWDRLDSCFCCFLDKILFL